MGVITTAKPCAKMRRSGRGHEVVDVWKRELGILPTRSFSLRFSASEDLVRRLGLQRFLQRHTGCVNTVNFNADGDILVSGSDDREVVLWNWETGSVKLSFSSGHRENVFQAKLMPFSNDHSLVTSGADGQVRHANILESGGVETSLLGRHQGQVHKLATEPGSPFSFYSCGEDGVIKHFDLRTRVANNLFTCKDSKFKWVVYLNAIAVDPRNPNLFAVGGMDEFARVYDVRSYRSETWYNFGKPVEHFGSLDLIGDDRVGITGLAFSHQSELLVSYSNEFIYRFSYDMGLGSSPRSSPSIDEKHSDVASPQVYKGHTNCETVKGVNFFGPKSEYVVSGSDCGRIFIWRKKDGELIRAMKADTSVVNCVESHPHMPLLCSSGIDTDIKIWTPEGAEKATLPETTRKRSRSGYSRSYILSGFSNEDGEDIYLVHRPAFYEGYADYDDEDATSESSDDDDDDKEEEEEEEEEEEVEEEEVAANIDDKADDCDIHNVSAYDCAENNHDNNADDDCHGIDEDNVSNNGINDHGEGDDEVSDKFDDEHSSANKGDDD